MSAEKVAKQAIKHNQSGFNCAQSVLLALYEHLEAGCKNELVPKIAAGFGGGIGRCGSTCGALSGSIMAVGIKDATNEPGPEKLAKTMADAKTLFRQFEKQYGATLCRDLLKYDLSNPEEAAKAKQEGAFGKVCPNLIKASIENFLALPSK